MPWASFERFELELPQQCVNECSRGGDATDAVRWWLNNDPRVAWNILCIPKDLLAQELYERCCLDDEELADWDSNREIILWIAANDIHEEQFFGEANNDK